MSIPQPKPYFIMAENKQILAKAMARRKNHPVNILIKGKHGMGKSELARQLAAVNKMDYVPIPIGSLQETGQLMGKDELVAGATRFVEGKFPKAIKTANSLIHLEELNRPESPKALNDLFPILDDSRCIIHEQLGEVKVADGVVFIATLNEGFEYSGIDPLDEALRDRFFFVELGYLPESQEVNLVMLRTGLTGQPVLDLVKFVNSMRLDGQNPIHISTRRLLMMAELVYEGLPIQQSIISCVGIDKDKLETILMKFDFQGKIGAGVAATGMSGWVLL